MMMWSNGVPAKCVPPAAAAKGTRLMIAGGQILPVLRKLAPSNDDVQTIWKLLRGAVHPVDLLVLILLGWGTVPFFSLVYYYCFQHRSNHQKRTHMQPVTVPQAKVLTAAAPVSLSPSSSSSSCASKDGAAREEISPTAAPPAATTLTTPPPPSNSSSPADIHPTSVPQAKSEALDTPATLSPSSSSSSCVSRDGEEEEKASSNAKTPPPATMTTMTPPQLSPSPPSSSPADEGSSAVAANVVHASYTEEYFLSSYMFQVANHVSQASRLAILVYLVDCLTIILTGLGFATTLSHRHPHTNLSTCFAKILYIVWAAQRLSVFKRYLLGRVIHNKTARQGKQQQHNTAPAAGATVLTTSAGNSTKAISRNGYSVHGNFNSLHHRHHNNNKSSSAMPGRNTAAMSPKTLGQAAIIDKVVDGIIYVVTGLFLLDILNVEMGVGVSSIFAFGSAGTLVMGLASRDVASMFVSGLTLTTTDHVREGDHVKFGDGTTGQILRIGWMHTTIRGYDELVEVIPNSILGMQRVKNISRLSMCQVKENLRLRYEDAERIPDCCAAILQEIREACPNAITDGTRPFRAVLRGFERDHMVVMVDVHFFGIKPIGSVYWNNRQEALLAIHRAVVKSQCQFVTTPPWPAVPLFSSSSSSASD